LLIGLLPDGAVCCPITGVFFERVLIVPDPFHGQSSFFAVQRAGHKRKRLQVDGGNSAVAGYYVAVKAVPSVIVVAIVVEFDFQVGTGNVVVSSHVFHLPQ